MVPGGRERTRKLWMRESIPKMNEGSVTGEKEVAPL